MNVVATITAALNAYIAWCRNADIRERRELRTEARLLRHEIIKTANSGDTRHLAELQNALADNQRDSAFILTTPGSQGSGGN